MPDGVCTGTEWGLSRPTNDDEIDRHYNDLKKRYTNCTYVEGNLEITWLKDRTYDLSFLSDITEVTGCITVLFTYVDVIPLTSLRVIRGKTMCKEKYALYVALNYHTEVESGLTQLQMPNLNEIVRGEVLFLHNDRLCYPMTINWDDFRTGGLKPQFNYTQNHVDCSHEDYRCHESCESGSCWGSGPDMCQQLTLLNCSQTCDYRCRGPSPADCCHGSCAAGCFDSSPTGCHACLHFSNGDECVPQCPPRTIYDSNKYQTKINPNFKYSYGFLCVDECPENVVINEDNCVKHCPDGKMERNGMCEECADPCVEEKVCEHTAQNILYREDFDDGKLTNCTIIKGNLVIASTTFNGDVYEGLSPIEEGQLNEFVTVREITGFLSIQAPLRNLDGLSFFRNLKIIHGRDLYSSKASLTIGPTNLQSLTLQKLKTIGAGDVYIKDNPNLCYVNQRLFENIMPGEGEVVIQNNKNPESCVTEGLVCHSQCQDGEGCWGPSPTQCSRCANAIYDDTCIPSCQNNNFNFSLYVATSASEENPVDQCAKCHEECYHGCFGPGAQDCVADPVSGRKCKNAQDGISCVRGCPEDKYKTEDNTCMNCHSNCKDGCSGPNNNIGEGACVKCHFVKLDRNGDVIQCLPKNATCESDSFQDRRPTGTGNKDPLSGSQICQLCHQECVGCVFSGPTWCKDCLNFKRNEYCVSQCDYDEYANENRTCLPCHSECEGCTGGSNKDCNSCRSLYVTDEDTNTTTCFGKCPSEYPARFNYECLKHCPENYFEKNKKCIKCHDQCRGGCTDDTSSSCLECRFYNQSGVCLEKCNKGWQPNANHTCVAISIGGVDNSTRDKPKDNLIIGAVVCSVVFFVLIVLVLVCFVVYKTKSKETVYVDYTSNIPMSSLYAEPDPTTPSGVSPNQAILTIIKETQLKRGTVLGSGAFGTVYKGLWIPEGEQKIRIPVAIKILRDVSSQAAEEFLEEAKVMASVDHPCLLRLLCVCMAGEITLITQLMPLGALLDYIRQHKEKVGSHHLLRWSHQIAEGMVYLEEHHLIHRDLAARNVLVQTPAQVKITDFGLAKFLNVDENVYKAQGGKMPIKWLALESIQYRRFSHKSDVWSFGVTLWEIMTFGGKPYDGVKARDVPELLVKGERLQQPPICTIDVYMLMVKCWLEDDNSRPSFKQLSDELKSMLLDPQRYLVVQHDSESEALPSPNPSDFYKSLLSEGMEGADPELLMDAEEYLQPMGQMKENYTYQPSQGFAFPPNSHGVTPSTNGYPMSPTYPMSPGAQSVQGKNPRKDSTLTRYSQDPIVARQYERQQSNRSAEETEEPHYQNEQMEPMLPRQDAYLPLADDAPTGIAVDNLEYLAVLGSGPQEEDVWSPREIVPPNGILPYKNGMTDNLSNSTPFLHNPKSPLPYDPRLNRMYSTPAPYSVPDHDYINDIKVGGGGESTV